jgi:dipeptidyl aminopeptidase/acylaminoacyl peptidase
LTWVEAQDGGDPKRTVAHRDRVLSQPAPFTSEPAELARTEFRFAGLTWTESGAALLTERDRPTRWTRTWLLSTDRDPQLLWDRSSEDRYADGGRPLTTPRPGGRVIRQTGNVIYLTGAGASPDGDRPFLDRLDLTTLQTERLFRSAEDAYEFVVAPLSVDATSILTRRESRTEPPNYYVRDLANGDLTAVTTVADPAPQLTGISKQLVTYARADGVQLSGTLYLPPGHQEGQRVPLIMWAYPREFVDPTLAGQISGSEHRFTAIRGASHLLLLTQGYAVFDGPSMPVIGGGDTANDTYIEQLVANAEAAVNAVVEMGVTDRDTIGVGGHSYGAFMTANLLAHSDLFSAGLARSGAYNRSLTPFGFQSERRTLWEATDTYVAVSPLFSAHKLDEPLLLIHGEADNNSGTFPIQSRRLYHAVKGNGGTVRLVMLPYESHGYRARESVMHTLAEMVEWLDRWVKNEPGA